MSHVLPELWARLRAKPTGSTFARTDDGDAAGPEGGGSKDRPCYVVGRKGRAVRVLYVTSRDRTSDDRYVPVDTSRWSGRVGGRRSWMQIAERGGADPCLYVRRSAFRRCLGRASSGEKAIVASAL